MMKSFKIIPILGRKTDVPIDDPTLFQFIGESVALTHDTGGLNFDLVRKRNACTKSNGYDNWNGTAISSAARCQGLFELEEPTQRSHVFFDHGKMYKFDNAIVAVEVKAPSGVTLSNSDDDLYCICKVGPYLIFTDNGTNPPLRWKHGQSSFVKLIASGTSYRFKYVFPFQRRVIGLHTDITNGDIDVRYSTAWPTTSVENLYFPQENQLWIPNDDTITGGSPMGQDRAFIYCRDSIQQLIYYPDYNYPFRLTTIIPQQGGYHHSIVNLGDRHYVFNRNYGFCEYRGGGEFPYGGRPISANIDGDIENITRDAYHRIQGCFLPFKREVVWTVPLSAEDPNRLFFYNIDTKQWRFEDKSMRFVDNWRIRTSYTWNDLITSLGGAGALWSAASTNRWIDYIPDLVDYLVYANTNGYLYYCTGEDLNGSNINGYRIEPVLDFGDRIRRDSINEIWFDIPTTGSFSIDVSYRSGDTTGELEAASWTSIGSVSCNSSDNPVLYLPNTISSARLHQIKWGTDLKDEKFIVNGITFKYVSEGIY
ncbi:MAG: hypothetical protein ACFFCW_00390 [Candidatus Hodarchaeota archaeon]